MVGQVLNWIISGISIIAFSLEVYETKTPFIVFWVYAGLTFFFSILNACLMINVKNLCVI